MMAEARSNAIAARMVRGYGLVEASAADCAASFDGWAIGVRAPLHVVDATDSVDRAMDYLSTLTVPPTRHVLFEVDGVAAFVNNGRNGSEAADHVGHVASRLRVRTVRVVESERRIWKRGALKEVLGYAARIVELYGADGEVRRSVYCMDDGGRWTFGSYGALFPVEADFPYEAKRKRDRFTSEHLRLLLKSWGLPVVGVEQLLGADRYWLVEERPGVAARTCTIEEADDPAYGYWERGLFYLPHIQTHAASVIADFERAVAINPDYEPRVREHLVAARALLGRG